MGHAGGAPAPYTGRKMPRDKTPATRRAAWIVAALAASAIAPAAQGRARGIVGRAAPPVAASPWFNLPAGQESVALADFAGKVVYLFFFQSW